VIPRLKWPLAIPSRKNGGSPPKESHASAIQRREHVVVRLQPYELDLLNGWMVEQDEIPEMGQDAIRSLIAMVCGEGKSK